MSGYEIIHAGRESAEPFSNYLYEISCNGRVLAELSHDYRRDEHWMRLPGGQWTTISGRILEGGGPQPLTFLSDGVDALERMIG